MVLTILAILAIVVAPRFMGLKESALKIKREEIMQTIESTINHGHQLYLLQQTNPPLKKDFKKIINSHRATKLTRIKKNFYKELLTKSLLFDNSLITIHGSYPSIFSQTKDGSDKLALSTGGDKPKHISHNLLSMLEITNTLDRSAAIKLNKRPMFRYRKKNFYISKKNIFTNKLVQARIKSQNESTEQPNKVTPPYVLLIALGSDCAVGIVQEASKPIKKPKVIPLGNCKS